MNKRLFCLLLSACLAACTSGYEKQTNVFLSDYSKAIVEKNETRAMDIRDSIEKRELSEEQISKLNNLKEQHEQMSYQLMMQRYEEGQRKQEERLRQIKNSFVGTYTIKCKKDNFTTHHVLKSYFSEEQTSREWLGTIEWSTILTIRKDMSACVQKVNMGHYNKSHRLVEDDGDMQVMEVGHLEVVSENLFFISTDRDYTFISDAIGTRYEVYDDKKVEDIGVDFETNKAVFDTKTNTLYQSLNDYKRRNDPYGYDWNGYEYAMFSFHR